MSKSRLANDLVGLKEKSYWCEEDGRIAVEAWQRSGLPLGTFAWQHGFGVHRLRWWRARLRGVEARAALSLAAIVPVTVVGSSSSAATSRATMEVVLESGRVVRVGADFDAEALMRLVRALEAPC